MTKSRLLAHLGFLFLVAILIYIGMQPIRSPDDIFWHVRTGGDILHSGFSAFVDKYSFTMHGQPIIIGSFLFDIVAYLFYAVFGYPGIQLLRIFFWLATLTSLAVVLKKYRYPIGSQIIAFLFVSYAMAARNAPRPELAAFFFLVFISFIYENSQEKPTLKTVTILSGLLVGWNLFHASAMAAFPFVGGYLLNWLIRILRDSKPTSHERKDFALAVVVFIVAGFANFQLQNGLISIFNVDHGWSELITEMQPPSFGLLDTSMLIYMVLVIGSVVHQLYRRNLGSALIALTFLWQAASHARMLAIGVVATIPFVISLIKALADFTQNSAHISPAVRKSAWAAMFIVVPLVPSFDLLKNASVEQPLLGLNPNNFPIQIVADFKNENRRGNMLADFDVASFLLLPLGDQLKFYLDGRTNILYSIEKTKEYYHLCFDSDLLKKESNELHIDYILTRINGSGATLYVSAIESGVFSVSRIENDLVLLKRNDPTFANLSRIAVHPEYVEQVSESDLRRELAATDNQWSANDRRLFLSEILKAYLDKKDQTPIQFVMNNPNLITASEVNLRFGTFMSERTKNIQFALNLYQRMPVPRTIDYLNMARLGIELQKYSFASAILASIDDHFVSSQYVAEKKALLAKLSDVQNDQKK